MRFASLVVQAARLANRLSPRLLGNLLLEIFLKLPEPIMVADLSAPTTQVLENNMMDKRGQNWTGTGHGVSK